MASKVNAANMPGAVRVMFKDYDSTSDSQGISAEHKASEVAKNTLGTEETKAADVKRFLKRIVTINSLSALFSSTLLISAVFILVVGLAIPSLPFILAGSLLTLSAALVIAFSIQTCRDAGKIETTLKNLFEQAQKIVTSAQSSIEIEEETKKPSLVEESAPKIENNK